MESAPAAGLPDELLSIGELARASGLSASALRFYDRAGVLRPAFVDPGSGYRWYTTGQVRPAQVVAMLRRVAMPLAEIGRVLTGPPGAAGAVIDGHLRRLETGLVDARRELSRVRSMFEPEESSTVTTFTVVAADLAAAVAAVRFAAGSDPEMPMLGGVLIELAPGDGLIRLVATDRFRLAVSAAPAVRAVGAAVQAIAPTSFVDAVSPLLASAAAGAHAEVAIDGTRITLRTGGEVSADALPYDFPDYRRLLPLEATRRVPVDAPRLREDLAAAGAEPVAVLSVGVDGTVGVEAGGSVAGAARIGVNPRFLSQALAAAGSRRIMLELREPAEPLMLRPADGAGNTYSLLMPVRLT